METDTFNIFVENEKWKLEECLRGSGRLTECDILAVSGADSLKEQYYWFMLGIACHAWNFEDGIDWEALERELHKHSHKVWEEWTKRKKAQNTRDRNY